MRRHFTAQKRRIPILHRNGGYYLLSPGSERLTRVLSDRLSRFGQFLRSTSIDELPELWNVVKGDMNLVGPRPLLMEYLDLYTPEQARRHEVRPGITGWAQVHGRNALTWDDKFAMDVWYVDHSSFWLDLKICAKTAWVLMTGGRSTCA